ncbi:MAG: peptidyl-prolyl cis-trans isomerase [Rhodospirillaceae bacterium]|nr:peptidyl-prolyl cis-trans isomerase [Rhodospirillaceae bacterium]
MLTTIRNKASSWVVKVLFGLLVASFAIWGISDIFRAPGRSSPAVEVDDVAISGEAVSRQVNIMLRRAEGRIDAEQAKAFGLVDLAVAQLVDQALLEVEARRLGLAAPTDYVRQLIVSNPVFADPQGKFDRDRFAVFLYRAEMNEGQYVHELQKNVVEQQMLEPLVLGAVPPQELVERIHAYRGERRVAKTLVLPPSVADPVGEPSEEALKAYYDAHKDDFMAPEYRAITLAMLTLQDVAKGIDIPEDRLRQEYEARKDQLGEPERRHILQLVVPDEATAKAAAERMKSEPFDAVAKSIAGGTYTDLGLVARAGLVPELADPAFAAAEGSVVGPIESKLGQTTLGWYLLKVEKIEPGRPRSFEEVRDELRQSLIKDEAASALVDRANQLDDRLAGGTPMDEAARALGWSVQKIPAVDQNGKAPDGTPVPALADNPSLLAEAFGTDAGETTPQKELPDVGQAILRVDGVQPAAPRPFDEVRAEVAEAWKKAEQEKALAAKADSLAEQARSGRPLEDIARELGFTLRTSAPFLRDEGDPAGGVDVALADKLFAAKPDDVVTAEGQGGYVLAQLVEIRKAEPLKPEEAEALKNELHQDVAGDLQRQFMNALRREIPVTPHPAVIDRLF